MNPKNQMNKYNQPWFTCLFETLFQDHFSNGAVLTGDIITSTAKAHSIEIPPEHKLFDITRAVRERFQKEKAKIIPAVNSDAELEEISLSDLKEGLERTWNPQKLAITISAVSSLVIPYLQKTYGGDASTGFNRLADPWKIKLVHFLPQEIERIHEFSKADATIPSGYISRIRNLSRFIWGSNSSPMRKRAGANYTGSPEIEALISEYIKNHPPESTSKTAASAARATIKLSGITKLKDLNSAMGLDKLIEVYYHGKISDQYFSRAKPVIRWLYERNSFICPPILENLKDEAIFSFKDRNDLYAELKFFHSTLTQRDGYKESDGEKFIGFFRRVFAANDLHSVEDFYNLTPSQFIKTLAWAETQGQNIIPFRAVNQIIKALTTNVKGHRSWLGGNESLDAFAKEIKKIKAESTFTTDQLNTADFESYFTSTGISWNRFFEHYKQLCYKSALRFERQPDEMKSRHIDHSFYPKIKNYILEIAYGTPCGNRLKGAALDYLGEWRSGGLVSKKSDLFTNDDKKTLQILAAFALQAIVPTRFRSEGSQLVYQANEPDVIKLTRGHFFFKRTLKVGEASKSKKQDSVFCFCFGSDKKTDFAYFTPGNKLLDAILDKYIAVFDIKDGNYLFSMNEDTLADEIKCILVQLFGHFKPHNPSDINEGLSQTASFEDFKQGNSECLTSHSLRHIMRRYFEHEYQGDKKEYYLSLLLGHRPQNMKGESSSAGSYGDETYHSVDTFYPIYRIKNDDFRSEMQINLDALNEENQKLHKKTQNQNEQLIDQSKHIIRQGDKTQKIAAANLMATIAIMTEEEQLRFVKEIQKKFPKMIE